MSLKFYGVPEDFRTAKALIAAKFAGVDIAEPPFKLGVDNKGQAYTLHKHPLGKVPVLETKDGCLFESNSIARFVARQGAAAGGPTGSIYNGRSAFEQAQIDSWMDFATKELEPHVLGMVLPLTVQQDKYNPEEAKAVEAGVKNVLKAMDAQLETRTFFVGERISLADVVLFCTLLPLFRNVADAAFRKPYANVQRWFLTCAAQAQVTGTIGTVPLCEKRPAAPKVAAKPAPAPKAAAAPKKAEPADDEPPPKPKSPGTDKLNALPKSDFDLDLFKRVYMNSVDRVAETCDGSAPNKYLKEEDLCKENGHKYAGLYKAFDPNGWSMYFAKYKYADELTTPMWQTSNLLRGTYQRMGDGLKLNKYGFAHMIVHQKPGCAHHELSGFWFLRGDGLPDLMKEGDDWEIFDWERIPFADIDQHKAKINAYLAVGKGCEEFMGDEVEDWNTML